MDFAIITKMHNSGTDAAQCLKLCTVQQKTTQAEYILDLQKQLTLLGAEPKNVSNGILSEEPLASVTPMHKIRSQLDDAVASDCPFCGDLMIREISLPFILPEEAEESESWEIKPHNHPSQRNLSSSV